MRKYFDCLPLPFLDIEPPPSKSPLITCLRSSLFDGKLKGIPIISIVGLLNDNYEGGAFMCREKEIKLIRGDILLFPSNFMYPHEVKEITKGIRYSFVSWAF